jgi:hypothetical protein
VERQEIYGGEPQVAHRFLKGLHEVGGVRRGRHLRLHDELLPRQRGQDAAKLHLGGAVAARGFDVVDPELQGAADAGFEVVLIVGRDVLGRDILPLELVAHAATGNDGKRKLSSTETPVLHGPTIGGGARNGNDSRAAGWLARGLHRAEPR